MLKTKFEEKQTFHMATIIQNTLTKIVCSEQFGLFVPLLCPFVHVHVYSGTRFSPEKNRV
jgi:hypothetical protein